MYTHTISGIQSLTSGPRTPPRLQTLSSTLYVSISAHTRNVHNYSFPLLCTNHNTHTYSYPLHSQNNQQNITMAKSNSSNKNMVHTLYCIHTIQAHMALPSSSFCRRCTKQHHHHQSAAYTQPYTLPTPLHHSRSLYVHCTVVLPAITTSINPDYYPPSQPLYFPDHSPCTYTTTAANLTKQPTHINLTTPISTQLHTHYTKLTLTFHDNPTEHTIQNNIL